MQCMKSSRKVGARGRTPPRPRRPIKRAAIAHLRTSVGQKIHKRVQQPVGRLERLPHRQTSPTKVRVSQLSRRGNVPILPSQRSHDNTTRGAVAVPRSFRNVRHDRGNMGESSISYKISMSVSMTPRTTEQPFVHILVTTQLVTLGSCPSTTASDPLNAQPPLSQQQNEPTNPVRCVS